MASPVARRRHGAVLDGSQRPRLVNRVPDDLHKVIWHGRGSDAGGISSPGGDLLLQGCHGLWIAQGGQVAELTTLRDVAQQAAHDLAASRLGQVRRPDDAFGPGQLADTQRDVVGERGLGRRITSCPSVRVTKATMACPVSSSGTATTAASATSGCAAMADSTSAVDSRCPETLITSSVRPMIQK